MRSKLSSRKNETAPWFLGRFHHDGHDTLSVELPDVGGHVESLGDLHDNGAEHRLKPSIVRGQQRKALQSVGNALAILRQFDNELRIDKPFKQPVCRRSGEPENGNELSGRRTASGSRNRLKYADVSLKRGGLVLN